MMVTAWSVTTIAPETGSVDGAAVGVGLVGEPPFPMVAEVVVVSSGKVDAVGSNAHDPSSMVRASRPASRVVMVATVVGRGS